MPIEPNNKIKSTIGKPVVVTIGPRSDVPAGTVTLSKGGHHWSFTCEPGQEHALMSRLSELARREDVPFDFFDVALVSHQLRNRLLPGLRRIDSPEQTQRPDKA